MGEEGSGSGGNGVGQPLVQAGGGGGARRSTCSGCCGSVLPTGPRRLACLSAAPAGAGETGATWAWLTGGSASLGIGELHLPTQLTRTRPPTAAPLPLLGFSCFAAAAAALARPFTPSSASSSSEITLRSSRRLVACTCAERGRGRKWGQVRCFVAFPPSLTAAVQHTHTHTGVRSDD